MLRLTVCFLITSFLFVINVGSWRVESVASLTRVTNTPELAMNLNPTLSDDGKVVVFESSADLAGTGVNSSFHAIRADLDSAFTEIGATRAVCPALSSDGKIVAFASAEDLVGQNADRNSEIFLFDGLELKQVTQTEPASVASRLTDGNFQPSITGDGRTIAFSSNRGIFLYDVVQQRFTQLTNEVTAVSPKISADRSRVYYKRATDLMLFETTTGTEHVIATGVENLSLTEGRAVSNDGMRVVYSALTGPNQTQVFLYEGRDDSIRQLTKLGSRVTDVSLQPTISGDGRRIAFATRRRVTNASDGGVELYVLDLPTGGVEQITA
ncbi:MAG TPA: hypothetical protein VM656_07835, partial [Pyrinomonadaceae bacterium]|nr:hypothetical protein [Pyrinomonadaceae bacterium]